MKDFRKLKVWEQAHSLILDVYRLTKSFPKDELYGLSSQMRRCGGSIGANIAEGCGKRGNGEFQRFLQIASGSASELDYHFLLSRDLGYLPEAEYRRVAESLLKLRRMLTSLLTKVEAAHLMAKC